MICVCVVTAFEHSSKIVHVRVIFAVFPHVEDTTSESIWIGTEKGLNQLSNYTIKSKNNNTCYTYNWNDGIRSVDFLGSCVLIDRKGVLWWGTGKGLTKLDRNELIDIKTKPLIRLRDVLINDLNVDYLNPDDSVTAGTENTVSEAGEHERIPPGIASDAHDLNVSKFDFEISESVELTDQQKLEVAISYHNLTHSYPDYVEETLRQTGKIW